MKRIILALHATCGMLVLGLIGCGGWHMYAPPDDSSTKPTVTQPAAASSQPLQAIVELNYNTVAPGGASIFVILTIVNKSSVPQRFDMMSCSWCGQWESDNPRVRLNGWMCAANYPITQTLGPGEAYRFPTLRPGQMPAVSVDGANGDIIKFRLGFTPLDPTDTIGSNTPRDATKTIWSNTVTVTVIG